jgi:hypothetical protein
LASTTVPDPTNHIAGTLPDAFISNCRSRHPVYPQT